MLDKRGGGKGTLESIGSHRSYSTHYNVKNKSKIERYCTARYGLQKSIVSINSRKEMSKSEEKKE